MFDQLTFSTLLQSPGPGNDQFLSFLAGTTSMVVFGAIFVLIVAGWWKVFSKANQPGWAAIIPIYNVLVLLKIVGRPWWWLLLMLIPLVNIILWLIVCIDTAHSYGKSTILWGVILLFFLSGLGFLMLGFGSAEYKGPAAAQAA